MKVVLYSRAFLHAYFSEMRQICRKEGFVPVFEASGRKGFGELMRVIHTPSEGVDAVICPRLDLLARSFGNLLGILRKLKKRKVSLLIPAQGIDTRPNSPAGKPQQRLIDALADFERVAMGLRSREILAGLKASGRPVGRPSVLNSVQKSGKALFCDILNRSGEPPKVREMAKELKISMGSAATLLRKLKLENQENE